MDFGETIFFVSRHWFLELAEDYFNKNIDC